MTMTDDAEQLGNGSVPEPVMPDEHAPAMPEDMPVGPAMSPEEMAAMEEELRTQEAMAAGSADAVPSPDEMMAMDPAMAEVQMNAEQEAAGAHVASDVPGSVPSALVRPLDLAGIDTSALEPHPLADLLPRMGKREFTDHRESIDLDGLQNPIVLYQGKILDGRNRYRACREARVPIVAFEFVGSEQQALTYVLASNQHRRHLTASQRAVVAHEAQPMIAADVNAKRIEKIRETKRRQASGDTMSILTECGAETPPPITSRAIAADVMGVSSGYVAHAKRIKEADPELYGEVWAGRVTIPEALRKLDGVVDDPQVARTKRARRGVADLLRDPDRQAPFLERLEALLAEFA